eukprot:14200885-Alexandrium_andersonii.AAC.1
MVGNLDRSPGGDPRDVHVLELACHRVKLPRPACGHGHQTDITFRCHHAVPWAAQRRGLIREEAAEEVVVVAQYRVPQDRTG